MSDPVFGLPSRRSFLTLSGIAVGGLALAACSGGATSTTTAGTGSSATEKKGIGNNGQVGKGRAGATADSLLIAGFQWGAPATFNPLSPTAAWPAAANVMQIVYESLLRWNILTGEIMPGLAKEYKVDGTNSVTLTLQDGITFSDGSPCTAKDVVATYELGKKNKGISIASFWQLADSIEATDDKTVVVKVNQKTKNVGNVLRMLTETYILPSSVFSGIADDKLPTAIIDKPIGTGPFTLSKADQTQVVLAINENYWGKTFYGGLPVMKQIIHPIFKSNEDGNIKFQAGELDIMQQFVSQIWKMWEGGKPVGTFLKSKPYFVPGSMPMLLMNTTKKGLDNAGRAQGHRQSAIDYASIAETAMSGYSDAVQASLILPTGAEGKFFNKSDAEANGWKYDAGRCREDPHRRRRHQGLRRHLHHRRQPPRPVQADHPDRLDRLERGLRDRGQEPEGDRHRLRDQLPAAGRDHPGHPGRHVRPGLLVRLGREPGHPVGAVQGHHEPGRDAADREDHLRQLRALEELRGRGHADRGRPGHRRRRQEGRLRQAGRALPQGGAGLPADVPSGRVLRVQRDQLLQLAG